MATSSLDIAGAGLTRAPARARLPVASPWQIWVLGFIVWTALALLSTLQTAIAFWSSGQTLRWSAFLPRNLIDWYTCAIFTPAYFWMVRRWPLRRTRAARTVLVYAAITTAFVVLKYALHVPLVNLVAANTARPLTFGGTLTNSFIRESIAFWCMLAVIVCVEYYRTERERELRETRLQAQLTEARLDALTAQLHPHFLFNTIQGISTLIHRDPQAADGMLARLSTLLRHTLQRDAGHEITLGQEMELLELYIGIMQERFGDRLAVTFAVAEEARQALVPRLLLQPLVENALHHGIARSPDAGHVQISAARAGESLVLIVSDDGPGYGTGTREFPQTGIGLANTRDRLFQLYGSEQSLAITSGDDRGFVVTVRLPWQVAPDA